MIKIAILLMITLASLASCKKENLEEIKDEKTNPANSKIVSVQKVNDVKAVDLKHFAQAFNYGAFAADLKYDVQVYKLEYLTTYKGQTITASGLIYLPFTKDSLPILSAHHGTTFEKTNVPSSGQGLSGEEFAASLGFITFSPDYLGYGSSSQLFHPYYDQLHSASVVKDMIEAGKEFLKRENRIDNGKLFLLGYSEGGYVTLAAQKAIEKEPVLDLSLTAVAAGAGGYDLLGMLQSVTSSKDYPYPAYIAFVVKSFIETYDWDKSLKYFFRDKYATVLEEKLTGYYSGGEVNSLLSKNLDSLFNPDFYNGIKHTGELEFKNALKKNSLTNFVPKAPTRLYHGTADEIVPYKNSEMTYEKLVNLGAKDVKLIPIQGGRHGSSFLPMLQSVYQWFNGMK